MKSADNQKIPKRLQVMICTHRIEGLQRVAESRLPQVAGVGYIVSCQSLPIQVPESLQRCDIKVVFTDSSGLSNNRNHALSHVTAPYALVADDDLTYHADALAKIIEVFDADEALDIATFECAYPVPHIYPKSEMDLRDRYKGYNVSSVEIALRIDSIRRIGAKFSPLMGIGAPYLQAGEEVTFLLSCLKRGLRAKFFPILIADHPTETTGMYAAAKPGVLRGNGAYVMMRHPWTMPLRLPLIAYRTRGSSVRNLWYLCQGALFAAFKHRSLLYPR